MRDIQFELMFHHLQVLPNPPEDLLPVVEFLTREGFVPARHPPHDPPPAPLPAPVAVSDLRQHFVDGYRRYADDERISSWLLVHGFPPKFTASLDYVRFLGRPEPHAELRVGGLADFEFKDDRPHVEPFAQKLLALGLNLYPVLRPILGWVDESWGNQNSTKETPRRIRSLGWATFFGPDWVARLGRPFLLGIPGHRTQELDDGGVFHQLTPTFVRRDPKEARALRKAVIDYFAAAGVKITCKAPYAIPGLTPERQPGEPPFEPGTSPEEALRAYLEQAWAFTMALNDGTRVKYLRLEWQGFGESQRQLVLDFLRRAVPAELAAHAGAPLRCEFNEIPPDLQRLLQPLVRDHPNLTYQRVTE